MIEIDFDKCEYCGKSISKHNIWLNIDVDEITGRFCRSKCAYEFNN